MEHDYCCWSLRTQLQVALGSMHQSIAARGASAVNVPGENPTFATGGIFTTETNIGAITQNEFCVVPEAGVTLACHLRSGVELTVGYSFIYWSDVARAGNAIDPTVSLGGGGERPVLAFNQADFWVQGLNLGLACEF